MPDKITIGPIDKGLRKDRTPFNIDDDSFPVLQNAYQWRGRLKRKRGTRLLGRLTRVITSVTLTQTGSGTQTIIPDLLADTALGIRAIQPNASIAPFTSGMTNLTIVIAGATFTDTLGTGVLTVAGTASSGTINYSTGLLDLGTSVVVTGQPIVVTFSYYPTLPVMGLEDLTLLTSQFPGTIAFDTTYSYDISTTSPFPIHNVNFYKNPSSAPGVGYIQKSPDTALTWNGQDYQQFWTINYQGALWATNGINVPFSATNVGMQFQIPSLITWINATTIDFTIAGSPLDVGDFVMVNEVTSGTAGAALTLNLQTGFVIAEAGNIYTVRFPLANITNAVYSAGMVQYLTTRVDTTKDCIRWYDGDPTTSNNGWVNFCPPLSQAAFSIADLPAAQYYLAGARMIFAFKDRLLFVGPVVQTSAANSQKYLQDTVIYSQSGTPYYTASFTGDPSLANTTYTPMLLPVNQTATASAWFEDQSGFGGYITAGIDQPINSGASSGDVLILGFTNTQTQLVYTGNDIVPFNFFLINSELGSQSVFSTVNLDRGVIARGNRGFTITSQTETSRIDLQIPDEVFEINLTENGDERFCAQRDYINEWIYFTYPVNSDIDKFPNQTLQYNYRDGSWATFLESYTTYGAFRKKTGMTWATVGSQISNTWRGWNQAWNSGSSTLLQSEVIAGNQQGFVMFRDEGTNEGNSLAIQNISGNTVTSPDHTLNVGDYIVISGALGTVSTQVNNKIFSVGEPITSSTFTLNPPLSGSFTYTGLGVIKRMYVPFIQSKQFPMAWGMGRKTRIGVQRYLISTTSNSQIQLLMYLSQDSDNAYNKSSVVPSNNTVNSSLVYSTVLYTCPESTNLGLTAANINLQMVTAITQDQTWHRINTSLIGDTVQIGFTMSDTQMRDANFTNQFSEIEIHGAIIDVSPSMVLA